MPRDPVRDARLARYSRGRGRRSGRRRRAQANRSARETFAARAAAPAAASRPMHGAHGDSADALFRAAPAEHGPATSSTGQGCDAARTSAPRRCRSKCRGRTMPPPPPLAEHEEEDRLSAGAPVGRIVKIVLLMLVIAGLAGAGLLAARGHHQAWWRRQRQPRRRRTAPTPAPTGQRQPKIADRVGAKSKQRGARHGAGRRGGAEGRALRRRAVQSEGQALCRLGGLAYRNRVARARGLRPNSRFAPTSKFPSAACT